MPHRRVFLKSPDDHATQRIQAKSWRRAPSVHARVWTNESAAFQSRLLHFYTAASNSSSAHEGLTLKTGFFWDDCSRDVSVCEILWNISHTNTCGEAIRWSQVGFWARVDCLKVLRRCDGPRYEAPHNGGRDEWSSLIGRLRPRLSPISQQPRSRGWRLSISFSPDLSRQPPPQHDEKQDLDVIFGSITFTCAHRQDKASRACKHLPMPPPFPHLRCSDLSVGQPFRRYRAPKKEKKSLQADRIGYFSRERMIRSPFGG